MQKLPVVAVVVVVVAVIAFLATRPAKRSWAPLEEASPSGQVGSDRRVADAGGAERLPGVPGGARQAGERRPRPFGKEKEGRFDVLRSREGSGSSAGGGAADVVAGQERRRGGTLGQSGSSRASGNTAGSGVKIADVPQGAGRTRDERRAEVVDFLGQVPRGETGGSDEIVEDAPADGEGEEDVVLSVPLNREHGTTAEDSTPPLVEENLQFADNGEGVEFGESSVLAFPNAGNVRGDAGTMVLDIEPQWAGAEDGDYSLVNVRNANDPSNLLRVIKNGKYLRYIFADASGQEVGVSYDISAWEPGERHTIAVNWGEAATALYVDNQLIGQNTYQGNFGIPPGTPLYLGSDIPEAGARGAGATISNFQVFGRPLTPDEIASQPTR